MRVTASGSAVRHAETCPMFATSPEAPPAKDAVGTLDVARAYGLSEPVAPADPCQRCGKLGGHGVEFRFDGISMSSWICPHCLDAQEKRIKELEKLNYAGVRVLVEPCEAGGHYRNDLGATFHPSKCRAALADGGESPR